VNILLKKLAAKLPIQWQQELKRAYFRRQIRKNCFVTDEQEFNLLDTLITEGDWIIDIGANIGHYTAKFSKLVGKNGRVVAFEPVPHTFELLAANSAFLPHPNVTLINAAASMDTGIVSIDIPKFESGLENYYMANLTANPTGLTVLCLPLDSLSLPNPIALIKIDAEGHELPVLKGMQTLLNRDHPHLIVEDNNAPELVAFLNRLGYEDQKLTGSSNRMFRSSSNSKSQS
jgi:FkbM family methyltransferase